MKAFIVKTFIGVIAINEKNEVIASKLFAKNPKEIAKKLVESKEEVEKELIEELTKKGYEVIKGEKAKEEFVKENLFQIAKKLNYVKNREEFLNLFSKVNIEIAKMQVKKSVKKDSIILHVNNAIEEIDKTINVFVERLRDWYSLHFPELDKSVKDHKKFAKLVATYGDRKNFEEFAELAERSMSADFGDKDIEVVKEFSEKILEIFSLRQKMAKYLESLLKDVAPNLTAIAGPTLAAKLTAKTGSLEKLAKMPSSTIQLIGSEKALFRFLRGRGKSPKHGLIFIHPYIQQAPKKLRGKIARALASKLSMAAKFDYFSKEYRADKLKKELKERIKEIMSKK